MEVIYKFETGWPSQVNLVPRISAIARTDRASAFKIGITCDPSQRASQYRASGARYSEMIVVYRTDSDTHVRNIEADLVEYFRDRADNLTGGGGGGRGAPPYYVYVVVQR